MLFILRFSVFANLEELKVSAKRSIECNFEGRSDDRVLEDCPRKKSFVYT